MFNGGSFFCFAEISRRVKYGMGVGSSQGWREDGLVAVVTDRRGDLKKPT